MNKRILGGLAAAAMLAGGLAITSAGVASANNGASDLCPSNTDGYGRKTDTVGNPATVSYTAPPGKLVAGYCVKAGTTTEFVTFDPPVKSVTIDHEAKDSVSHYSIRLVPAPEEELNEITPPVLTASYDCVAKSASYLLLPPPPSADWTAGEVIEDQDKDTFSVDITPKNGNYFPTSEEGDGSITLTAQYTETTDCEVIVAAPTLAAPDCSVPGSVVPSVNPNKYTWSNEGNTFTATPVKGVRLVGQTVFEMNPLPKLTGDQCLVPPVVDVVAPIAPTQATREVVSAFSPALPPVPAGVAALPPVVPAAGLPATGIDGTGVTALIALLLTSLGGAALFASRRRNVTI